MGISPGSRGGTKSGGSLLQQGTVITFCLRSSIHTVVSLTLSVLYKEVGGILSLKISVWICSTEGFGGGRSLDFVQMASVLTKGRKSWQISLKISKRECGIFMTSPH